MLKNGGAVANAYGEDDSVDIPGCCLAEALEINNRLNLRNVISCLIA
jgi:hypothetical protein